MTDIAGSAGRGAPPRQRGDGRAAALGRRARRTALLLALGLAATAAAASGAALPPGTAERLDAALAAAMARDHLPSLSAAIARDGEIVYARALGLADVENAVAATSRTVYPVGSITKALTAVAAMQLVEAGQLDLAAPIDRYCPEFVAKGEGVTIGRLLAHLGGVRGYDYRRFEEDFLNCRTYDTLTAAIGKFRADPLVAPPGSRYQYSGWGYVLVGCAIERAAAATYGEYLHERVLAPSGMSQATLDVPGRLVPFRARGYSASAAGAWANATCFNPSDRYPAGGLLATPSDLVRFGSALLAGKLVTPASRDMMWTEQRTVGDEPVGYGLGWNVSPQRGEVFHGGSSVGATAYLYLLPEQGLVIAFATNLELWSRGRHELAGELAAITAAPSAAVPPP